MYIVLFEINLVTYDALLNGFYRKNCIDSRTLEEIGVDFAKKNIEKIKSKNYEI